MDIFIEKIVARKKTIGDYLIISAIILAGLIIWLFTVNAPFLGNFALVIAVGVIYGVYFFASIRNIEYEYAVTNGDLDIDTIVSKRKRKRIFSANCKDFEIVAKVGSENYNQNVKNINKRIVAVSSMESTDVYFVVLNYKGEKTVVFFEPDTRMLNVFKTLIPRKVMV